MVSVAMVDLKFRGVMTTVGICCALTTTEQPVPLTSAITTSDVSVSHTKSQQSKMQIQLSRSAVCVFVNREGEEYFDYEG